MTYRVFAVQPTGAIELLGTYPTQIDAERALTSPGFHVVDDANELVLRHKRTDDRVSRLIATAIEKRRHPAFGADAKQAPVQRLPSQRPRGREPELIEVDGVARTRDEWAAELDLDVSTIYQSARRLGVSFGEDVARRVSVKKIRDAHARARAERRERAMAEAPVVEAPSAPEEPTQEREDEGDALVREVVREVEETYGFTLVEEPAPIAAQEPEQRPEPTHPELRIRQPSDGASWFTAREVRILSAVLEHGGVEQLLNNAELGRHVREMAAKGNPCR